MATTNLDKDAILTASIPFIAETIRIIGSWRKSMAEYLTDEANEDPTVSDSYAEICFNNINTFKHKLKGQVLLISHMTGVSSTQIKTLAEQYLEQNGGA